MSERLDPAARELESLQLALRTRDGVPAAALPDSGELAGLVARRAGRAVLTRRGRLLANEVAIRLQPPPGPAGGPGGGASGRACAHAAGG
jgi:hypothetical protein